MVSRRSAAMDFGKGQQSGDDFRHLIAQRTVLAIKEYPLRAIDMPVRVGRKAKAMGCGIEQDRYSDLTDASDDHVERSPRNPRAEKNPNWRRSQIWVISKRFLSHSDTPNRQRFDASFKLGNCDAGGRVEIGAVGAIPADAGVLQWPHLG